MAITPPPKRDSEQASADTSLLAAAAVSLRQQTDSRWVEVSDRVLAKALTATRRSPPVRAQAPGGPVQVSAQVLIAYLRAAIDKQLRGSALTRVEIHLSGRDRFSGLTIVLVAEYGQPLLSIADRVREVARAQLAELLGPVTPEVTVRTMHVHFGDVTVGDPATTDPAGEGTTA